MCGIAGSFSYDVQTSVDVNVLQKISACMQARGPDGKGFWLHEDHSISLVHRRLAIIDLSANAAQPMSDVSGRYVISYNGEIYNHPELRKQCEQKGYQFVSQSDTEVLLALYQLYHIEMLSQLRGMFAFAICDVQEKTMFLARDPHGIKPLYYVDHETDDTKQCTFASSLQALRHAKLIDESQVDVKSLASFYHTGSVSEPLTWYQQAKLLPAGSYRMMVQESPVKKSSVILATTPTTTLSTTSNANHRYWHLPAQFVAAKKNRLKADHNAIVRQAVTESVQAHMLSDVPIGLFLSAGIDSSVLATLMRQFTDQPIQAITLRFSEYQNTHDDESIVAGEIARRHGLDNHVYTLGKDEFIEELPKFFAAMEQPTIDGLNTWFVAKAAKQLGLKVVISGVGGDELFGGYPSFSNIPRLLSLWPILSSCFKLPFAYSVYQQALKLLDSQSKEKWSFLPDYANSIVTAYRLQRGIFLQAELDPKLCLALIELEDFLNLDELIINGSETVLNVGLLESQCYLRNQLLRDADWASMAHSLEIRMPFVDSQLSTTLASVPASVMYKKNKATLVKLLSSEDRQLLAQRPKTGFTLPMQQWLSQFALENNDNPIQSHWSRHYASHVVTRFPRHC